VRAPAVKVVKLTIHRLLAVRRKGYMRSQESSLTASIEYVASAYYCLCFSFFFLLEFV